MWATLPLMVKKRGGSCVPLPLYSTNINVVSSMTDPVLRWPQTRTSATRFSVVRRETKFSSCSFCSLSLRISSAFLASSDHLCSYCHISAPPPATRAQTMRILINCAFMFILFIGNYSVTPTPYNVRYGLSNTRGRSKFALSQSWAIVCCVLLTMLTPLDLL